MATSIYYAMANNTTANYLSISKNNTKRKNALKNCYIKANYDMYVYKSANFAYNNRGKQGGNGELMQIKIGTAAKITGVVWFSHTMVVSINCGNTTGYVVAATFNNKTNTANNYSYDVAYGLICFPGKDPDSISKQYGIPASALQSTTVEYLSTNTKTNTNQVIESGSSEDAEPSEEAEEAVVDETTLAAAAAAGAGVTGSTNSADGDINVTYEFAVKSAPSFVYNIMQHINRGVTEDGVEIGGGRLFDNLTAAKKDKGINYANARLLFGAPYQFLPTTDCRFSGGGFSDDVEQAGYEFVDKILSRMPLLYITPGNTSFMGNSTEDARTMLLTNLGESIGETAETALESMLSDYNGKLYTLNPAYTEYFNYVNPMCRAGAIFLGIQDKEINGTKIERFHWGINKGQDYQYYIEEEETDEVPEDEQVEEEETEDTEDTEPEKEAYDYSADENYFEESRVKNETSFKDLQSIMYYSNAIAFYINSEASFQDSFSNEVTESSLASTINALSDRAREIQFLLGTASSAVGEAFDKVDGTLSDIKEQINNIVKQVAGGNSIFTTIANSVKTIVSGGRMIFPQIWSNSTFSKSYNISIKLVTPSYDKFSWWLNIYVPLCHLMALVLPRSEYVNSYTTPFIVKAFYRGMFNIDMGIITEMSFTRGKEGSWTKDTLPTVVDVSFTLQDLYTGMGMTSVGSMFKGLTLQNIAEMDYIANLCGVNINEPDIFRMVILWKAMKLDSAIYDFLPNLELDLGNALRNTTMNLYNNLWF